MRRFARLAPVRVTEAYQASSTNPSRASRSSRVAAFFGDRVPESLSGVESKRAEELVDGDGEAAQRWFEVDAVFAA